MKLNPTLIGFLKKEFLQALRDKRMRVVLFVAPIMQLTIFGVAISNEVRNIRLAASFEPPDTVIREILDRSYASGWFIPASVTGSDPFEWIQSNQADAVIVAPPGGLLKAVERGEGRVQFLVNAKNALRAQSVENYMRAILREVAPLEGGSGARLAFDVRILYNPTLITSVFMVPGVMCMLVCIVTVILTSMALAREKEMGTFETLIAAPVRPYEIILGKTVPFILLGCCEIPLILTVGVALFDVPVRGSIALLMIAALCFVTATVSLGILISTLARSQQQAMLGGFLFLFPAVLLSGLMFPLENMPLPLQAVAYLNPLAHFIAILRNLLIKGGDMGFFLKHLAALIAIALGMVVLSFKRFKTQLG